MAESPSMTTPEVVAKTLIEEHADFLREAVAMAAAEIMEAEISAQIGADKGEVSASRSTHRNGYRDRLWETRVGEIELAIPKKRSGGAYFPSFLEPRKRSEQAIVSVVMEAYVNCDSGLPASCDRDDFALPAERRVRCADGERLG